MGKEPWRIPTREEMESKTDTAEQYPDWHRTRWKLFKEPELLIQALDEAWSPLAKAVARTASLETSQSDIDEAGAEQKEQELAVEKEKGKAAVAVAKAKGTQQGRASKPKRKDGYLASTYTQLTQDVVISIATERKLDHDWVSQIIRTEMETTVSRLIADQILSFRRGYIGIRLPADV
jgi:hypothetical protein